MAARFFWKSRIRLLCPIFARNFTAASLKGPPLAAKHLPMFFSGENLSGPLCREFHDGRPRGPLWRGKKLIGKEALFVIQGLKRFKDDEEKLDRFIETHVSRLLKLDMIAVLGELQRQGEVSLAIKVLFSLLPHSIASSSLIDLPGFSYLLHVYVCILVYISQVMVLFPKMVGRERLIIPPQVV